MVRNHYSKQIMHTTIVPIKISKQSRPIFFGKTILEEYEAAYLFQI